MNVESSRSSRRPPRSLVIDRVSQAGAGLARASVDLARDLAREFVEPPVQTSTLIHRHVSAGQRGSTSAGDEIGTAKATAADLESAPSGDGKEDGSHTKQQQKSNGKQAQALHGKPPGDGESAGGRTNGFYERCGEECCTAGIDGARFVAEGCPGWRLAEGSVVTGVCRDYGGKVQNCR